MPLEKVLPKEAPGRPPSKPASETVTLPSTFSNPDSVEAEKEKVRLAIRELWEAFRLQDRERLNAIIDDEYVSPEGENKDRKIASYLDPSFIVKSAEVNYKDAKVRLDGDRAVVGYTATDRRSLNGESVLVESESTDVFIKRDGKWRLYRGTNDSNEKPDNL